MFLEFLGSYSFISFAPWLRSLTSSSTGCHGWKIMSARTHPKLETQVTLPTRQEILCNLHVEPQHFCKLMLRLRRFTEGLVFCIATNALHAQVWSTWCSLELFSPWPWPNFSQARCDKDQEWRAELVQPQPAHRIHRIHRLRTKGAFMLHQNRRLDEISKFEQLLTMIDIRHYRWY